MVILETQKSNKEELLELQKQFQNQCEIIDYSSSESHEVVQLLIEVTKITAPYIAGFLTAKLSSEIIRVKKNGIDITTRLSKRGINKAKMAIELLSIDAEEDEMEEREERE